MFHKPDIRRQNTQFRKRQIILSAILALCAVYLGLSIAASLFALPFFPSVPGNFFAAAYGILAFLIPGILFWAAILLADPRYRPDKIFLLGFAVFPFMTLALGFVLLKDFSFYVESYPFLKAAGRAGLSFGVIFLTVLELSVMALLRSLIFKTRAEQPKTSVRQETSPKGYIPILPPPEARAYPSLAKTGEFEHATANPLIVRDHTEEAQSAGGHDSATFTDNNEAGEPEVL
ncbi:MAG: hypothetical protein LBK64_00510, partial [Spirochaetaceae bacterium]|nr:hypothetical protein [Spirochaetaceae bacterium]